MFHSRRKSFCAMGVDVGQYVIWYRIYRFRQIILQTFFSEIDTRSICSDIVWYAFNLFWYRLSGGVVVVGWALCV